MKAGAIAALVALGACGAEEPNKNASGAGGASTEAGRSAENGAETHSATGTMDSISANEVTISHGKIKSIGGRR